MDIRDALQLAEELVLEHGLEGWSVTFDRAKTRAGACRPRSAARERAASPRRRSASTAHGWAPVLPDTGSPATSDRRGSPRALSAVRAASTRGTSSPGRTSASPPRCTRTT